MDKPLIGQQGFLPEEDQQPKKFVPKPEDYANVQKPKLGANGFLDDRTATSGNPIVPDSQKIADVYPVAQITGQDVGTLYNAHKEVMTAVKEKRDTGLIRSFKAKYTIAELALRKSWIGWQLLTGADPTVYDAEVNKIDQQIADESNYIQNDDLFDRAVNSVAGLIPVAWASGKEGLRGGLLTGMAVGGTSAFVAPPTAPVMTAAAFTAGTAAFSAKYISEIEAGSLFMDLYKMKDSEGNQIDPRIVKTAALAVGAINGAIEAAQVKLLLKTVPGLDKAMSDIVKKSVTKLLKDGTVSKYLLGAAGRYTKFLAGETAQEIGQEVVAILGEEIAKETHEQFEDVQLPETSWDEIQKRLTDTAVESILGFGILGAPGHALQIMPGLEERSSHTRNEKLKEVLPPDQEINYDKELTNTFERVKNVFFGKRDLRLMKNKNESVQLKEELSSIAEEGQDIDELAVAIQLHIDSKNNPEAVEAALRGEKWEPEGERPVSRGFEGVKPPTKASEGMTKEDIFKHMEEAESITGGAYELGRMMHEGKVDEKIVKEAEKEYRSREGIEKLEQAMNAQYFTEAFELLETLEGKKDSKVELFKKTGVLEEDFKPSPRTEMKKEKKVRVKLNETQIKLIEMSKNLTEKQKAFAKKISDVYKDLADEALSEEVIFNTINNFASRSWITKKKTRDAISRLYTTTVHAKERRLPTIVEGWAEGLKMVSHSAIDNLTMYRENMIKVLEQKRLISELKRGKTIGGNPIFTTEKLPYYEQVKMQNYSIPGGLKYFAPRKIAKEINNIFGVSGLYDAPGIESITKLNALLKKIALSTSFFHNVAFIRSFYLGGRTMQWNNLNPFTAHREGVEMIKNMDDIIKLGVYNGLTLNIIQDWEEDLLSMQSDLDRIVNKNTKSKRTRGFIRDLWRRQVEFTFGVQGAGLKAKAFATEFLAEVEKNPTENVNKIAERVAHVMNSDFGGLHLERMARNPTWQHIFRLVALAPDWTESNIRTVIGMVNWRSPTKMRQLYRRFWARVILKSATATAMANVMLAGGDFGEAYERWKVGVEKDWKNVASVDITPLYNLFGMHPKERKYFSIAGHFLDPFKYADEPPRSIQYKFSMLGRLSTDWLFQENWQGKRFKNLAEIPAELEEFADFFNAETYTTYKPESKRKSYLHTHFSFPSYVMYSVLGSSPIAMQNFFAMISGEISAMDAILNTIGIRQKKEPKHRRRGGRR